MSQTFKDLSTTTDSLSSPTTETPIMASTAKAGSTPNDEAERLSSDLALFSPTPLSDRVSRLCAIHGGTFMLSRDIDEVLMDENGQACGVEAGNEMAKASMVIGDPTYFSRENTKLVGMLLENDR